MKLSNFVDVFQLGNKPANDVPSAIAGLNGRPVSPRPDPQPNTQPWATNDPTNSTNAAYQQNYQRMLQMGLSPEEAMKQAAGMANRNNAGAGGLSRLPNLNMYPQGTAVGAGPVGTSSGRRW